MIYSLWIFNDIANAIFGGLRTLLMSLCDFLYSLIMTCLDLFYVIGRANIVDNDIVSGIYQRVGLILGIFMLFRLTFSFVQMMISPDQISDKEKGVGSLVKKVVVVIAALALTPAVFTEVYNIQGVLLDSHVVEKVILGAENNSNLDEFSPQFSYYIFRSFYKKGDEEPIDSDYRNFCDDEFYDTLLFESVVKNRNFNLAHDCLNVESGESGDEDIDKVTTFDGWTAILIGVFVLYVLVMYIITLGMRVAKLAFLQLVAPVPILSYLSPKKETGFQKWLSQCISTFLDVFIRLAIITFGVMLMRLLVDNGVNQTLLESTGLEQGSGMLTWVNLILILGILLFIKKAPELIGEIFPSMGGKGGLDFGLGLKSRTDFAGKRAIGAGIAAAGVAGANALHNATRKKFNEDGTEKERSWWGRAGSAAGGLVTGAFKGAYYGASSEKVFDGLKKGLAAENKSSQELNEIYSKGGGYFDTIKSKVARKLGIDTPYQSEYKREVAPLEEQIKEAEVYAEATGNVRTAVDAATDRTKGKINSGENATTLGSDGVKVMCKAMNMSEAELASIGITGDMTISQAFSATKLATERLTSQLQTLDDVVLDRKDYKTEAEYMAAVKELETKKSAIESKLNKVRIEEPILKKLNEYTVSLSILGKHNDAVMNSKIEDAINSARVASETLRSNGLDGASETLNAMLTALESARSTGNYTPTTFNGKVCNTAFDLLDAISIYAGDISSETKREIALAKEEKRQIEEKLAGKKAADGGGK